jgi:hypothetical protein
MNMNRWKSTTLKHAAGITLVLVVAGAAQAATISGTVRMQDGMPVSGVTMKGLPGEPVTNDNGVYSADVPPGWTGTVTPTEINFVFDPETRTYSSVAADQTGQDYVALQRVFSIFGYIRSAGGIGIADVALSGFPTSVATDPNGYYQTYVLRGWSGTVTPALSGFNFDPATRTYANVTANAGDANYLAVIVQPGDPNSGGTDPNNGTDGTDGGTDGTDGGTSDPNQSGDGTGAPTAAPALCGTGACGAGVLGWVPVSLLGLCGLKLRGGWRRDAQ